MDNGRVRSGGLLRNEPDGGVSSVGQRGIIILAGSSIIFTTLSALLDSCRYQRGKRREAEAVYLVTALLFTAGGGD